MSETSENFDFVNKSIEDNFENNFSFYNYTKRPFINFNTPNITPEINFFEKFHINFNLNNLILKNNKDDIEIPEEKENNDSNNNISKKGGMLDIIEEVIVKDYNENCTNTINNTNPKTQKDEFILLGADECDYNNYEDFNNMENINYNYIDNEFENDISHNVCNVEKISDKFQVFAIKPTAPINNTQNSSYNIKNIDKSNKKVITKEFFSQQVNSIGNIHITSQMTQITEIENKFGIVEGGYECPDYDSYSEEKLKEEMKKYGMKPGSNKFMIKQLKQIWEFLNMSK
jgi:hypothetical protein